MIRNILLLLFCFLTSAAYAGAIDEIADDTEDLANEADAAAAETKEIKQEMAKEKAKARAKYQDVSKEHRDAVAKRAAAVKDLKNSESEIDRLASERVKLLADIERLKNETAIAEKTAKDNQMMIEKAKLEIETLKKIRSEKQTKLIEVSSERDRTVEVMKGLDQQKLQADIEFQKLKEQEKFTNDQLQKTRLEEAQKKARLDAYLAQLKEKYKETQEKIKAAENEQEQLQQNTAKLEAQAKAGEAEVEQAEAQLGAPKRVPASLDPETKPVTYAPAAESASSAASSSDLTFKRKCRVFDKPGKGGKPLGSKSAGSSVTKSDEGKNWIAFTLKDGRKVYAAKACF